MMSSKPIVIRINENFPVIFSSVLKTMGGIIFYSFALYNFNKHIQILSIRKIIIIAIIIYSD